MFNLRTHQSAYANYYKVIKKMDELQLLHQILSSLTLDQLRVLASLMFLMAILNALVFFAFQFTLDAIKFFISVLLPSIRKSLKSDNSKD